MYDARAVGNFFIERACETGTPITIMTLLKVVYFSHAWYMAKFDKPLVGQPFEAWKHGPVSRVIYSQFSTYGENYLDKALVHFNAATLRYEPVFEKFDDATEIFLCNIFDYYAKFHPFKLSDLTHEIGGPWDLVWKEAEKRAVPGMVIPNKLIVSWFRHKGAVHWASPQRSWVS